jgi:hypothetical protein
MVPLHVKNLNHTCKIAGREPFLLVVIEAAPPPTLRQLSLTLPFLCRAVTVDDLPALASRAISTIAKNAAFFTYSCTGALTYEH